ncbi:MAG: hypothetical protein F4008_14290, partial [Gammaproteobacteria bacterium]|nr:hypothetical protein [Gammaproteobacteria bacterium]
MDSQQLEEQLLRFLKSDSPGSFALWGNWGVGKTFTWKKYIQCASEKDQLTYSNNYSYVSLFGVNSLEELKFQIFQNQIPGEFIGREDEINEKKMESTKNIFTKGKKFGGLFLDPAVTKFANVIRSAAYLTVNKALICIDDIERKGNGLTINDTMGLISQLTEEKNCKVVLIYNSGVLQGEDKTEYDNYREKVIDIEFEYKPSTKECCAVAFSQQTTFKDELTMNCIKLEVDNIRILRRIANFTAYLEPLLEGYHPGLIKTCLNTLCLYAWCYYSNDGLSPNYTFVKKRPYGLTAEGGTEEDKVQKARWSSYLQSYKYNWGFEVNSQVAKLIESGSLDQHQFRLHADRENERIQENYGRSNFFSAFDLFFGSFEDNEDAVV